MKISTSTITTFRVSARRIPALPVLLLLAAIFFLSSRQAKAASAFWDDSVGDDAWGTLANWSTNVGGGTSPASIPGTATTDLATFSVTGQLGVVQTVNLGAARSLGELSFNNTAAISLLGGGTNQTLTLAGITAVGIIKAGTGAVTIGSNTSGQQVAVALSANQSWVNNNNTGAITVLNGVASSTAVARTLTLDGTSTAANTISGVIADNGVGVMTINKTGAGTWVLSGANTYTGVTTVTTGTLMLGSATALGSTTGSTSILTTLDLNGQAIGAETVSLTLATSALVNNSGTAASLSGGVVFGVNASSIGGSGVLTLSGLVSGGGNQAGFKIGTGTLILSGSNTFSRALTVSAGVLNIQNSNALGLDSTNIITVSANAALQMQGGITIAGTAKPLTLNGTGVANDGALRNISGTNTYNPALTLASASRINSDAGLLIISGTNTITGATFDLTVGGAGDTTISTIIGTTTGDLNKDGTGTLTLSDVNTFTGTTTVTSGTLAYGITNALSSGAVTVTAGTLDIKTFSDTVGAVTLTSGTIAGSTGVLTATSYAFNGNGTASAILAGAVAATKTGVGTITTLSGSNTYSGATTITSGALNIRSNTALGAVAGGVTVASGAALQLQNNITVGAEALTLNGSGVAIDGALRNISGTNTYGGLLTLGSASRINSDAGLLTLSNTGTITGATFGLTVGGAGDTTIASIIGTGTATLTKDGAGTLTLSGSNSYAGATTISSGALNIRSNTALGTVAGGVTVANLAALQLQNSITVGAETLTLSGSGVANDGALRNISGNNTYGGALTLGSNSRINSDAGLLTLSNTGAIAGAFDLTVGGAGNTTIAADIIGTTTGGLNKDGTGTLAFAGGINNYTAFTGTLNMAGGTLSTGSLRVGNTSFGTLNVTSGSITSTTFSYIGTDVASTGTANVSGGTWSSGGELRVGFNGRGTLNVSGSGSVTNAGGHIGYTAGSNGTATVSSGSWGNSYLYVGSSGTGTLNMTGGIITTTLSSAIGTGASGYGTATVTGGTWANSNELNIGQSGTGTLLVNGGLVTSGSGANIAFLANSLGSVTVTSGTWDNTGIIYIGRQSSGTMNVNGGYVTNSGTANIGHGASGIGTVNVSSGTWINGGDLRVGLAGNATLNITGGKVTNASGVIGTNAGSVGTATVSSGTWANSGDLTVGGSGTGTLTMTGGLVSVGGTLTRGASGTINLNSGGTLQIGVGTTGGDLGVSTLTNNGSLIFNRSNASTYSGIISGTGSVTKQGAGTLTFDGANSYSGLTTITAGTLQIGNSGTTGSIAGNVLNNSTLAFSRSNASTYSGIISGTGAVTKLGGGILTFNGSNSYTGATSASAGTFFINGNQAAATGAVDITGTGILGGIGTIGGSTTIGSGATLSPGQSPGVLTFGAGANLAFTSTNSKLLMEISGTVRGTTYDGITLSNSGTLTYGGDATFTITTGLANGTVLDLIAFTGPDFGTFDSITLNGGAYTGGSFSSDFAGTWTLIDSNGQTLTFVESTGDLSVIPEPSSLALFGLGAMAVWWRVRRRRGSLADPC